MSHLSNTRKFRERIETFHKTQEVGLLGILNVTPDSFFDGGKYSSLKSTISAGLKMIKDGADIIDIGGMSSRPGALVVSEREEWTRVEPIIKGLLDADAETLISIDTYRAEVARKAVEEGAVLVNDISGGTLDPELLSAVASLDVAYVLMHMKGRPESMQNAPSYENVVKEVIAWFQLKLENIASAGIQNVIIDPGFGFGKRVSDNYQLLNHLHEFSDLNLPLMVGISRKSMIHQTIKCTPDKALNGTTILHSWAVERGASLLRVHDIIEAREVLTLHHHLCNS